MLEADEFIQKFGFKLPPFAYWSVPDFQKKKLDGGEIINDICSYFQIKDWTLEMNNDNNFPVKFKFPLSLEPIE